MRTKTSKATVETSSSTTKGKIKEKIISKRATIVDPNKIQEFDSCDSFNTWLSKHHDNETEVFLKIHKVNSGLTSISRKDAVDVALCWGWIDAIAKSYDEKSYLQRYTPRKMKSIWSKVNVANVTRLIEEGKMTSHGLIKVDAAKANGSWDNAYGMDLKLPDELLTAIGLNPRALTTLNSLSSQNRFAMAFRLQNLKTESARKRNIEKFVEMLARGETLHPQKK
jgi:uncharacterized protein YdeI (YjbR/CyaY-like superfamily)